MRGSLIYVLLVCIVAQKCVVCAPLTDNTIEDSDANKSSENEAFDDTENGDEDDDDFAVPAEADPGKPKLMFDEILRVNNQGKKKKKLRDMLDEGDIMKVKVRAKGNDIMNYEVIKDMDNRWEMPVHYFFNWRLSQGSRNAFKEAAAEITEKTSGCITFKEVTSSYREKMLHVVSENGCWSYIGDVESMKYQKLSLSNRGCGYKSIATHEILHALGFHHEQSRSDRDNYIKILWNNIASKNHRNFQKASTEYFQNFNVAYDYYSIMHYQSDDFARRRGLKTIELADGAEGPDEFGQPLNGGMSNLDLEQLMALYCNGSTPEPPPVTTTVFPPPTNHPSLNCTGTLPRSYNGVCKDQVSFCGTMAGEGWCDNCWVQSQCLQTCSGPDKRSDCDRLRRSRSRGCETSSWIYRYYKMDVNCRATCEFNKC